MEQGKTYWVAIRKETKSKWERRAPLTPKEVKSLVENGIKVLVQPSTNRWFMSKEYEEVGAIIQDDISEADLILGVKEVPIEHLIADKTYMFFSHTIKAQPYNMPSLDKMLELKIRLIDYEPIKENGVRLVAFGRYAGIAGTIDFLRGVGEYLLEKKFSSFFVNVGAAYMYENFDDMKDIREHLSFLLRVNINKKSNREFNFP